MSDHKHWWHIATPSPEDERVMGICKICGETRDFTAFGSEERYSWRSLPIANRSGKMRRVRPRTS